MQTHRYTVHSNGPALWPEHRSVAEIDKLRATTPELIWEGTYQGWPTPAGGYTFKRVWWDGRQRFRHDDRTLNHQIVGRYQAWDTAEKDKETNDYSVCVTADIMADYRLFVRHVYRARLTFDALPDAITSQARLWNRDGKLRNVVIEDKSSGTAAYQTLRASAEEWLRIMLVAYQPPGSKVERAGAASVWCRNGMVWLPHPGEGTEWLIDFEDEIFSFPQATHDDQADAFSELVIFTENYLSAGWHAKRGH